MPGDLERLTSPKELTFSHIRRNMDPCCSYLVFENTLDSGSADVFKTICRVLDEPEAGVQDKGFYRDPETGRLMLVVRLDPHLDQMWKDRILGITLPGQIKLYFYGQTTP